MRIAIQQQHNDQDQILARGQIQIGIQRLVDKYPFHAKTLERFLVICRPEVGTMGVTVANNNVCLLFNPRFVNEIRADELGGVLLHEVHHVVFGHILVDPRDYPDRWARVVAEETTVNEYVAEPLPGAPILLKQFPMLPPKESTDRRYKRLRQEIDRLTISETPLVGTGSQSKGSMGILSSSGISVVDDHTVWQEAWKEPEHAKGLLRGVIQDAVLEVGLNKVPQALQPLFSRMGIGNRPGDQALHLTDKKQSQCNWGKLLRRFIGRHRVVRTMFGRPSRRFPNLVGIVPGKSRRGQQTRILAVVDTSASMTKSLLEQVNGELACIASTHHVTVVECDVQVQRVYPYRPIQWVFGRGGTDLRPVFEPVFLQTHRPDLMVYFTDGFGSAPPKAPQMPVLWCLTPRGRQPAAWGEAVKMSE